MVLYAQLPSINENKTEFSHIVIGLAIDVHRELGPGLLAYEECLVYELKRSSIRFVRQEPVSITYKGLHLECGYRLDLLIEDRLVVELKSVDELLPIFDAQVLTYMKLANKSVSLLINFNVPVLKMGLKRFVR
jgi:GxxExxY protein